MRNRILYILFFASAMVALFAPSCRKARIQTVGGAITFSDDTLTFDTVFTAAGSFTTGLLIRNPQNQPVVVSSVRMLHGTASYFRLNVDGFQGNEVTDVKIPAHDSVYVFATVRIDPNDHRIPFIVTDSLVATMNGQTYYVPFMAYGQNAHYIVDSVIRGNVVWDSTLPYVVLNLRGRDTAGGVFIAGNSTLTLQPGCKVYMHQNAWMFVFGKLIANGTKKDSVIFQGDRLDRRYFGYEGYPGEWAGIYFYSTSSGSKLTHTRIENCGNGSRLGVPAGIYVDIDSNGAGAEPQLTMDRCVLQNSIGSGIYARKGSVTAINCLFNSTGGYALAIIQGGRHNFTNCTFANYGGTGLSHTAQGTVAILNFYRPNQNEIYYGDLNATMRNCLVYGSLDSEIVCSADPVNAAANLLFDHCLLKMGNVREPFIRFDGCLFNQDPLFVDPSKKDFHLKDNSPANNKGDDSNNRSNDLDLDDMPRSGKKAIGCYSH